MHDRFVRAAQELGEDAWTIECRFVIEAIADERERRSLGEVGPEADAMEWVERRLVEMCSDDRYPVRIVIVGMNLK